MGAGTYYFRVRAGNGCAPGDYSNEVATTPFGLATGEVAEGFIEGVLGTQAPELGEEPNELQVEVKAEQAEQAVTISRTPLNKIILVAFTVLAVSILAYYLRRRN